MNKMNKVKKTTIKVEGRKGSYTYQYVTVAERIRQFHLNYPNGMIQSEYKRIQLEGDALWIVKAIATPDITVPDRTFTGHAQEIESVGLVNKTSALENAETSAWGRCLGCLGLDIDNGIASAEEIQKATQRSDKPTYYLAKVPQESWDVVSKLNGVTYNEEKKVWKLPVNNGILSLVKGLEAKVCDNNGKLV